MSRTSRNRINEDFARRFRTLMGNRSLTLKDISERTGNAISTIGTWKNGKLPKNRNTRTKVAKALGVSEEYLYEGKIRGEELIFCNEIPAHCEADISDMERAVLNTVRRLIESAKKSDGGMEALSFELLELEKRTLLK